MLCFHSSKGPAVTFSLLCTTRCEIINNGNFQALLIEELLKNVSEAHKTAALHSTDAPDTAYDAEVLCLTDEGAGDAGSIFDGVYGVITDGVQQ